MSVLCVYRSVQVLIPTHILWYSTAIFAIFTCRVNTDLGDSDFQIKIIKGIQYPLPSGMISYRAYCAFFCQC